MLIKGLILQIIIGLMKNELGGNIIMEFVALRPKAYSYITNDFI